MLPSWHWCQRFDDVRLSCIDLKGPEFNLEIMLRPPMSLGNNCNVSVGRSVGWTLEGGKLGKSSVVEPAQKCLLSMDVIRVFII